jgi:alpha,alpha-trehalase
MRLPFFKLKTTLQSQLTKATNLAPPKAAPDELLGELFHDVQLHRIHADSKIFTDLVPEEALKKILKKYQAQRHLPGFDLEKFVQKYFRHYTTPGEAHGYHANPKHTVEEHINELWNVLTRECYVDKGSLIALPHPYIVPGGRFNEQFYWDSYFAMLGLAASNRYDLVENMMKNYAFMIRKIGYIPTANRTYFLSRSQPPFFTRMVDLLAAKKGKLVIIQYLPYLLAEYRFWMKGSKNLSIEKPAYRRAVRMPDGSILNRYFDNKHTPRQESYIEDVETALTVEGRIASQVYTDLRASAESGWDFSSRWFKDGQNLNTIHTTEIIPVDLNCLLVELEQMIARGYRILRQPLLAKPFEVKADKRIAAIRKYCWVDEKGFYFDHDFVEGAPTSHYTLAGVFPLYSKTATQEEASTIAEILEKYFLQEGGLLPTVKNTGQQWDAPNGWAPLHWCVIQGLRNYGYNDLANEIKKRWCSMIVAKYATQLKLVEKYNVMDINASGGGGEYELQDGFGWTNGVLLALLAEKV